MEEALRLLTEEVKLLTKRIGQSLTDQDANRRLLLELSDKVDKMTASFEANKRGNSGRSAG